MLIPIWLLGFIFAVPYLVIVIQTVILAKKYRSRAWWRYTAGFILRLVLLLVQLVFAMWQQSAQEDIPAGFIRVTWIGGIWLFANLAVSALFIDGNRLLLKMFKRGNRPSLRARFKNWLWSVPDMLREAVRRKPKPPPSAPPQ